MRYATNDRVHRYQRRLFQIGNRAVPMGVFIRYDAYKMFALLIGPAFILCALPLGPALAFAAVAAGVYLHACDGLGRPTAKRAAWSVAAGVALWWLMNRQVTFGYSLAGVGQTLLWACVIAIPWSSVAVAHMHDRGVLGFLGLARSEASTLLMVWHASRARPRPQIRTARHVTVRHEDPQEPTS